MSVHPDWLRPGWQLPGIGAVMSTRAGGVGRGSFDSLNLHPGVGDEPAAVEANRRSFADAIQASPVWLQQVHGTRVVRLTSREANGVAGAALNAAEAADASVTTLPGVACTVQVADCLPLLFAAPQARAVGAAHAGWRGLAAGVVEATLAEVCRAGECPPQEVRVWLGACIGPRRFEVGREVLQAFGAAWPAERSAAPNPADGRVPPPDPEQRRRFRRQASGKWLADLPLLARDRLQAAGVRHVSGGDWCTVDDRSRFFSFRRDRVTGRMAAAIWIERGA